MHTKSTLHNAHVTMLVWYLWVRARAHVERVLCFIAMPTAHARLLVTFLKGAAFFSIDSDHMHVAGIVQGFNNNKLIHCPQ